MDTVDQVPHDVLKKKLKEFNAGRAEAGKRPVCISEYKRLTKASYDSLSFW